MSFNLEVFFNPEDDYEGNRTTKVFVLSSQKMTNETGNVALVCAQHWISNRRHFVFIKKKISVFW